MPGAALSEPSEVTLTPTARRDRGGHGPEPAERPISPVPRPYAPVSVRHAYPTTRASQRGTSRGDK